MKINPNDPAFSKPSMIQRGNVDEKNFFGYEEEGSEGLTKREYFAIKAMQALITHEGLDNKLQCAVESVAFADALIATLNK